MPATLKLGCIQNGCCVRVEGRGTMEESLAAREAAARVMDANLETHLFFDLSACDYLDSTFLGCLVELNRSYRGRFSVMAPQDRRNKLFGAMRLDKIIPAINEFHATPDEWISLDAVAADRRELLEHVMDCHRRLSECDTPMKSSFARIADQMRRELNRA